MKKTLVAALGIAFGALASNEMKAETVHFSNLSSVSPGFEITVDSSNWLAQLFQTDSSASSFTLNSFTLNLGGAADTSGNFFVALYSNTGSNLPGSSLGTLSGNANPSTAGQYTYVATGLTLDANTKYWVLAGVSSGNGSYSWIDSNGGYPADMAHTGNWSIFTSPTTTDSYSLNGGGSWNPAYGSPYMFSASATAVPEPSTYALLGLGLVIAGIAHLRRRAVSRAS